MIATGGKQYLVKEGDVIEVELVESKKSLTFTPLAVTSDDKPVAAKSAKVQAKVLGEERGEKLVVFKMKAKKRYRRKTGHRQTHSRLQIEKISV